MEFNYYGLFLFAFLSASIIPVSSEAAIAGAIMLKMPAGEALFWAGAGNCLGIAMNYGIGLWSSKKWLKKYVDRAKATRSFNYVERYGYLALLLSWIPVIGDPITILAGVVRMNFIVFVVLSFSLRILRYYLIVAAMIQTNLGA